MNGSSLPLVDLEMSQRRPVNQFGWAQYKSWKNTESLQKCIFSASFDTRNCFSWYGGISILFTARNHLLLTVHWVVWFSCIDFLHCCPSIIPAGSGSGPLRTSETVECEPTWPSDASRKRYKAPEGTKGQQGADRVSSWAWIRFHATESEFVSLPKVEGGHLGEEDIWRSHLRYQELQCCDCLARSTYTTLTSESQQVSPSGHPLRLEETGLLAAVSNDLKKELFYCCNCTLIEEVNTFIGTVVPTKVTVVPISAFSSRVTD